MQDIKLIGDEILWLKDFRQKGKEAFISQGIPTAKTEAWKYTKPNRFLAGDFSLCPQGSKDISPYSQGLPFKACKIYFENGIFSHHDELPEGVEILPLIEVIMFRHEVRDKIGFLAEIKAHPFAALNSAYLNEGVYIHISANVTIPLCFINHIAPQSNGNMYNLRNLVVIDDNSSAELVEYYCYDGDIKSSYLVNIVNEIYVGRGAALRHWKVQDEAFKSGHIALNSVEIKAEGLYQSFCLQKGADLARNETEVVLAEEGGRTEVDAAYIMNGWATIDTTTDIKHLKPFTKSLQIIKGVIGGQAKGVFQGKIHIAPQAVKTEGYQLHKAMLLSDEAEIDVKPELEIFADDVKCSHGSASGELDKEQLFYMQSRGIGTEKAKQILIDAYLNDVIAKVDNENIRLWIKSFVGEHD